MNLDRFQPPTDADDRAICQGACQRILHYEELNDDGICEECANDEDDEET
jgi:hypothetical protein